MVILHYGYQLILHVMILQSISFDQELHGPMIMLLTGYAITIISSPRHQLFLIHLPQQ